MSLYQEVYHGESFSEEDFYDAVRYIFQPEIGESTTEEIDDFLIETVSEMTPEQAESFWKKIGNFAKKVGSGALKVVSKVAQPVGTAVGAAYGVPQLGGMIGGLAGNLAGAGSKALDRIPDFKTRRRRRRTSPRRNRSSYRRRSRRNPELRNAWRHTRRTLGRAGRHALRAANRYAAQNPVRPRYREDVESFEDNTPAALSNVVNSPGFQALLFGRSNGNIPTENITESDYDFLEAVEAINYLTEGIIAEYYENDLLEDDEYLVDDYGELVINHPEEREERIEALIEEYSA